MNNNEKIVKEKNEIGEKLKDKELMEIIKGLICFFILSGFFGYIGYIFCIDNNYDIRRGITFGILYPIGLALLEATQYGKIFYYIIYTIIFLFSLNYVPTFVGMIMLFLIIILFIVAFISTKKKDRTKEINSIHNSQKDKLRENVTHTSSTKYNYENVIYDNENIENNECEYECERCLEKIPEEEFEFYDGMCEECFYETHYDLDGNIRKEYWNNQ